MAKSRPRIRVPKKVAKGEVIEIKTLISHPMESGQRKDKQGNTIPRKIINRFEAYFNGRQVFAVDLHPAISANPYLSFFLRVDEPGELEFRWIDDDGTVYTKKAKIRLKG